MDKVIQHNSRIFCFTKSWLANNFQSSLRKKRIVQKSSVLVVQCLCWFFEIWLVEVWKKFSHIVCFFFFLFFQSLLLWRVCISTLEDSHSKPIRGSLQGSLGFFPDCSFCHLETIHLWKVYTFLKDTELAESEFKYTQSNDGNKQ